MSIIRNTTQKIVLIIIPMFIGLTTTTYQALATEIFPENGIAIFATNSASLKKETSVTGDVVVNETNTPPLPMLNPVAELQIDKGFTVDGNVSADTIAIASGANITGTTLTGPAFIPPLFVLPSFQSANVLAVTMDVVVPAGEHFLPSGDYRDITINADGNLILQGVYNIRSIEAGTGGGACGEKNPDAPGVDGGKEPCQAITFLSPSDVRIETTLHLNNRAYIGPAHEPKIEIDASKIIFYVGGSIGPELQPLDLPYAVDIDKESTVHANIYAPNGTIRLDKDSRAEGALLGRDVLIDTGVNLTSKLADFRQLLPANLPPTADPQTVYTNGAEDLEITLTGSDPNGTDLELSIIVTAGCPGLPGPCEGTLGPITPIIPPTAEIEHRDNTVGDDPDLIGNGSCDTGEDCETIQPPVTSAMVTYAPNGSDDLVDSFLFQVKNGNGDIGQAIVDINKADPTPPPNPLSTVVAFDGSAETGVEVLVQIILKGEAPCDGSCDGIGDDVPLTFSVESDPDNGTLTGLTQGSEDPQRSAEITYTPDSGFSGGDSFVFNVCGIIGSEVCDTATVNVNVFGELATDQSVEALQDTPQPITLLATLGAGSTNLTSLSSRSSIQTRAAFLLPSDIAGNTADADGDGLGDNHNDLPGPTPVFMSAGVDSTGGPGSNGIKRMQIEWDISDQAGLEDELESAQVILNTHLGSVDSLDTLFFYIGSNGDGALTDDDFQTPAEEIQGVVMPIPEVSSGTDGTFTFDVTEELRAVLKQGFEYFIIQGRVDESLAGQGSQRGLEVKTSAEGNQDVNTQPQLSLATPTPPLFMFSIVSLPSNGILFNSNGIQVTSPSTLPDPNLTYVPNLGFSGDDSFGFQVEQFNGPTDIGTISINVLRTFGLVDTCVIVGREPGCIVD